MLIGSTKYEYGLNINKRILDSIYVLKNINVVKKGIRLNNHRRPAINMVFNKSIINIYLNKHINSYSIERVINTDDGIPVEYDEKSIFNKRLSYILYEDIFFNVISNSYYTHINFCFANRQIVFKITMYSKNTSHKDELKNPFFTTLSDKTVKDNDVMDLFYSLDNGSFDGKLLYFDKKNDYLKCFRMIT